MKVDVHINGGISSGAMKEAMQKAIFATSEQALKDCNYFCKQDTGALIQSSLIYSHIDFNKGVLRWTMPYAEKQYKLPSARRDKNPNASSEWCKRAESDYGDQWQAVFKRTYEEEISR